LVKTDSLGEILWTRTYGGTDYDYSWSVKQSSDGGYIIIGTTESFGAGSADVYLIKTNSSGDTLWTGTYGGTGYDEGWSVQETSDGGYIITGFFDAVGEDVILIKTDSLGDTLWTRTCVNCSGISVQQTSDGGYIITGGTGFGAGSSDFYLSKTDSNGLMERDGGVVTLDAPGDTIFSDSSYAVQATVRNFGMAFLTLNVIATIDGYTDTVQVTGLLPGTSIQVTFKNWQVPPTDSFAIYGMTVCTEVTFDTDPTNDCDTKTIYVKGIGPGLISAVASDNVNPVPEIDNDDYVLITFDEATNKPTIDASNINAVLILSGGHSWLDGSGFIGNVYWNGPGDQLIIYLSTVGGLPSVAVADAINPDSVTITDVWGNPAVMPAVISGSFDPQPGVEETARIGLPKFFSLSQNHPNPFYLSTTIHYTLPVDSRSALGGTVDRKVSLKIYELTGRLVRILVDGSQESMVYRVQWEGSDDLGQKVPSGIYFYRLQAGDFITTKKMIFMR